MSTAPEKDLNELKHEYASLKSDLTEMSETISNLAHDGVAEGRKQIRGAARHSRDQARETWGLLEHEIKEQAHHQSCRGARRRFCARQAAVEIACRYRNHGTAT
ncbi:MAG: hypothetical protein U5K56_00290 [Halioglobus sp.]|nr:hypothetical protein [Halioglobus sp.]